MHMRLFLLSCAVCVGYGRRKQALANEDLRGTRRHQHTLAMLLLAVDPMTVVRQGGSSLLSRHVPLVAAGRASGSGAALRMAAPDPHMMASSKGMAILFDCDGVLADTERDGHRVSFNKIFAEKGFGFEWAIEEYGRLCEVGGGKERMTAYFNGFNGYRKTGWPEGFKSPETEELTKGLPDDAKRLELVKTMHAAKTARFQELIASGVVPLRPGILRIVDEAIAADVPLAVCSTSNEAAVRTLVETLMGPERYQEFEFFCGDCVPRKKPNPDVYNLAAETMGLEKSECVVIEDSGIGNKAAKAAGMACLVTTSTYTIDEDFAGADRVVPMLGEPGDDVCIMLADLRALLPKKDDLT